MAEKKGKPVVEFRAGNVRASIWARKKKSNSGSDYTEYAVTFSKSYRDADGEWKNSDSYFPSDLALLGLVTVQAQNWIYFAYKENA